MLDPKFVRENPEALKQATRVKRIGSPQLVDEWLAADEKRRQSQTRADELRSEQRKIGEQVGTLKRQLKGQSSPELESLLQQTNTLKQQQQTMVDAQAAAEAQANEIMLQLPAIPDATWPVGADAAENKVARSWA